MNENVKMIQKITAQKNAFQRRVREGSLFEKPNSCKTWETARQKRKGDRGRHGERDEKAGWNLFRLGIGSASKIAFPILLFIGITVSPGPLLSLPLFFRLSLLSPYLVRHTSLTANHNLGTRTLAQLYG